MEDAKIEVLHHIPGAFPKDDFPPVAIVRHLPRDRSKVRELVVRILAAKVTPYRM